MDTQKTEAVVQFSTIVDLANLLSDEQKNFLIQNLLKQQNDSKKLHIPFSIFSSDLSCLETICKYLREELNISFNEMSVLLNRKPITLRTTYNNAKTKHPERFTNFNFCHNMPISILRNRKYTTFEIAISYLKENGVSLKDISKIMCRSYKTIWTTYSRSKKK